MGWAISACWRHISWSSPDGNILSGGDSYNPVVDAPGQYLLRYVWPAPFNTFVETIYTFSETYFAGIQGGGSFGLQDHTVRFGINYRL